MCGTNWNSVRCSPSSSTLSSHLSSRCQKGGWGPRVGSYSEYKSVANCSMSSLAPWITGPYGNAIIHVRTFFSKDSGKMLPSRLLEQSRLDQISHRSRHWGWYSVTQHCVTVTIWGNETI